MTQSLNLRNIAAASAVAAFVAVAASSGQASAAIDVRYCEGGSRQSVRECCETLVKRNGLPMWMRQTGRNCVSARIVCRGGNGPTFGTAAAAPKICRYVVIRLREGGGNQAKGNNSPNGRAAGKP